MDATGLSRGGSLTWLGTMGTKKQRCHRLVRWRFTLTGLALRLVRERLQRERPPDKPVASKTKLHRYPLIVHGETRVNSVFTCISLAGDLLDLSLHKNYRFDLIDGCFYDDQFLAGLR
jgi:hypothetical protein